MIHNDLCDIGVKWLKRNHGRNGPGCKLSLKEPQSGFTGEIPDAIGWRVESYLPGCFVIEAKTSRSDFLADFKKPHRNDTVGLGNYRFYLCPEGVINPDELPNGWGLLWVNDRGHIKSKRNPYLYTNMNDRSQQSEMLREMYFESDKDRELFILISTMSRIESPEKVNQQIRDANRGTNQMVRMFEREQEENNRLTEELTKLKMEK